MIIKNYQFEKMNNRSQRKIIIPGIIAEIIFNKDIYKSNADLREFTNIFDNHYADYLFNSRPLLYSRLIKEFKSLEEESIDSYYKQLLKFINALDDGKNYQKKDVKQKNNNTDNIKSWSKLINPGRYDEK